MVGDLKEVFFDEYCPKCKYHLLDEAKFPCSVCLKYPARVDSHVPEKFDADSSDIYRDYIKSMSRSKDK